MFWGCDGDVRWRSMARCCVELAKQVCKYDLDGWLRSEPCGGEGHWCAIVALVCEARTVVCPEFDAS